MVSRKQFSLDDFETLSQAARVLRAAGPSGGYALEDVVFLSPAAELLEISIPELPQELARIKLLSLDTNIATAPGVPSAQEPQPALRTLPASTLQGGAFSNHPRTSIPEVPRAGSSVVSSPSLLAPAALQSSTSPSSAAFDATPDSSPAFGSIDAFLAPLNGNDNVPDAILLPPPDLRASYQDGFMQEAELIDYNGDEFEPLFQEGPSDTAYGPPDCDVASWDFLLPGDSSGDAISTPAVDPYGTGFALQTFAPSSLAAPPPGTRQQAKIAPRPMGYRTIGSATVKAKPSVRRPIMDAGVRKEISDTRQRNACIRCRMQKLKCAPDPKNRHDRCLECSQAANSIYRQLPCLRYKIPDTPLFRHAMYNSPFYLDHPLLGDRYGDFHLQKTWVSSRTKTLSALHHGGLRLEVEVRQYLPPGEEDATDDRSMHGLAARPMYTIPWAVADADIETRNLGTVVDRYIESYVVNLLKPGDDLVWPVYQEALRLMPVSDLMLDTMRLWVGARLADRGWRCTGSDKLGAETLENQLRPPDWTPLPPYLDYQLVSIIMHRYLSPLRKKVLDRLQTIVRANKPSNWYAIFLTCFVLLHSCEMSIVIVRKHAAKRKSPDRYIIMNLVRALNTSAKVLLAHFHYCCKGNVPFSKSFDWSSPVMRRMAALDPEQSAFMSKYVSVVHEREDIFEAVRKTDHYEAPYWFVCQLFEENWEPRVTHEHSPTSDEAYISGSDHVVTEKGKTVQFGPYHRPDIEEDMSKRPNRGG